MRKAGKLTIKEKKFVSGKIKGLTNEKAYDAAGYGTGKANKLTKMSAGSAIAARPLVQRAIEDALAKHNLTPDYAIEQLAKIVAQDEELGAKRLAIKDSFELMGWNKAERANVRVEFKGNFFASARGIKAIEEPEGVLDGEIIEQDS